MSNIISFFKSLTYVFLGIFSILISSCSVYKQQFDCPPPEGISCASVTEIESMIVETEKGPDLLVIPESNEDHHSFWCIQKTHTVSSRSSKTSRCHRRVWLCSQIKEGDWIKGHYLQGSDIQRPAFRNSVWDSEEFFSSADQH